jgi:hypothetical protein
MQVFYVHTFTVSPQVVGDLEEESSDTDQDDQATSAWRQRGPDKAHDGTNQHDDDADAFLLDPCKRKPVQDSMVDRLCSGRWRPQVPLPSLAHLPHDAFLNACFCRCLQSCSYSSSQLAHAALCCPLSLHT